MIGVGIIGLGMAVKPHALALRDLEAAGRVRVMGGFAPSGDRRAGFAAAWGWPAVDRIEALLATPGLGLAVILTPPHCASRTVRSARSMLPRWRAPASRNASRSPARRAARRWPPNGWTCTSKATRRR